MAISNNFFKQRTKNSPKISSLSQLERKLYDKTAVIGIVGLGYVGLPLAAAFAEAGLKVKGFDVQEKRVDSINRGESYINDVNNQVLAKIITTSRLQVTTDQSHLRETDAILICVPTPLTKAKEPNMSYIIRESEEIAKYLRPGQLIVLESTTYPGTTRDIVLPILERTRLKAGRDFYLVFSPERVDPGNKKFSLKNTPKLVGGLDDASTALAASLYRQVVETVIEVSSPEVAEMTKIFENVFRLVNIALVNELASLCENMGISVWEVIEAASSKPYGYMPFYPGPGVGGHCIPLDPYYLSNKAKEFDLHVRFIELAAEINERMPHHVVSRIIEAMSVNGKSIKDAKVLLLGVSYKKDVEDTRESPSLKLIRLLREKGAVVSYNDPYIAQIQNGKKSLKSVELTRESVSSSDCVVIATDHSSYDYQSIVDNAKIVFDTRGATRAIKSNNIIRLGEQIVGTGHLQEVEVIDIDKVSPIITKQEYILELLRMQD